MVKAWAARGLALEAWNPLATIWLEGGLIVMVFAVVGLLTASRRLWAYLGVDAAFSFTFMAAVVYVSQYAQLPDMQALTMVGQLAAVHDSVTALLKPSYLLFFVDLPVLAVLIGASAKMRRMPLARFDRRIAAAVAGAAVWSLVVVAVAASSGPIADSLALGKSRGMLAATIASPFLVDDLNSSAAVRRPPRLVQKDIDELMGVEPGPRVVGAPDPGSARGKHVIVVQVESLQTFVMGATSQGEEITPNLNRLLEESWYVPNGYTQIGKGNTSDAEFVLNTSLVGLRETAASVAYADKAVPSLPRLLAKQGYESHTFHANEVSFWSRDTLYPMLGFTKYWDDEFFGEEDVLGMGASDRVFYQKTMPVLRDIHDSGGRVYANLITLSNHSPFRRVSSRSELPIAPELKDTTLGRYLKACNYTDETLGEFVAELKAAGMWDESILVIYGDHFGLGIRSLTEPEHDVLEDMLGYRYSMAEHFRVPIIVRTPGQTAGGMIETSTGMVDLMPTIADLAGLDLSATPHLGRSIFEGGAPIVHLRYYAPEGTFIANDLVFRPGMGYEDSTVLRTIGGEVVDREAVPEELYERAVELLRVNNRYLSSLPER